MTDYLSLDIEGALKFTAHDMVGKMIGVMGSTGSGKSYSSAVFAEELHPHMPMSIIDPAGEYWTLREKFEVLIAGRFLLNDAGERVDHCDVEISVEDAENVAEFSFRHKVSIILDLLLFSEEERADLLAAYFNRLWELVIRHKQPYVVICDEAHNFVPQNGKTAVKRNLIRLAKEGRKFGVTFIFVTQRPASITKDVITQAQLLVLHGVYYPTDVATYTDAIPGLKPAAAEALIEQLQPGQAIIVNRTKVPHTSIVVTLRKRLTTHAGATPELNSVNAAALREVDEQTVEELKALLIPAVEEAAGDSPANAAQRDVIATLQRENATHIKEIVQLRKDVEHWKGLAQGQSIGDALPGVQLRMDDESLPDEIAEKVKGRESAAQTRVVKRQSMALNRLKLKVAALPAYEREVLYWLSYRQGQWFEREDITRTLIINPKSLTMQKLVDTGLVERDKRSKFHKFRFREGMLKQMFPDLNAEYVLDQISPIKEKVA